MSTPSARLRRAAGLILLAAFVATAVVVLRLDGALARAHGPSGPAGGFGAVASPAALLDPPHALAITQAWHGSTDPVTGLSAGEIIVRYAATDTLLALLLATLLTWGLRPSSARAPAAHGHPPTARRPLRGLAGIAGIAVAYVLADWSETLYLAWVWDRPDDGGPLPGSGVAAMALVGTFSVLKWLTLLTVVALVVAVRWRRRSGGRG